MDGTRAHKASPRVASSALGVYRVPRATEAAAHPANRPHAHPSRHWPALIPTPHSHSCWPAIARPADELIEPPGARFDDRAQRRRCPSPHLAADRASRFSARLNTARLCRQHASCNGRNRRLVCAKPARRAFGRSDGCRDVLLGGPLRLRGHRIRTLPPLPAKLSGWLC